MSISFFSRRTAASTISLLVALLPATAADNLPPPGFVRLIEAAPMIRQLMSYATPFNFMRRPLPGYGAQDCLLRREAAAALSRVQKSLQERQLRLVVFDCYRPQRAVDAMNAFVADRKQPMRSTDFPSIDRTELVRLGYIASRSMHSTGYAVDLAFAPYSLPRSASPFPEDDEPCTGDRVRRGDRDLAEFGTRFDCFDPKAATKSDGLSAEAAANRALLIEVMGKAGFENYSREWWHFTYRQRADTRRFDHPIEPIDR